jgi:hypothetical protein
MRVRTACLTERMKSGRGGQFGGDGPGHRVGFCALDTVRASAENAGQDNLLIFIVQTNRHPRGGQRLQQIQWQICADPWGPRGAAFERRNFEGDNAPLYQRCNVIRSSLDCHSAVERHIGMGMRLERVDLCEQSIGAVERIRVVIGHIDQRGDTTCNGGGGRLLDPCQSAIAGGMGLTINHTGQDQGPAMVVDLRGASG